MGEGINERSDARDAAPPSIYRELAAYQRTAEWYGRDVFRELQGWLGRFDTEFKLDIPETVLRVDALPVSIMGHYRHQPNGLGLKGEVALNVHYLADRPFWQILAILLHQCVHGWQHAHGTPSREDHHNLEFREKAAEVGLLIDRRGLTDCMADGRFVELLRALGVDIPRILDEAEPSGGRDGGSPRLAIPRTRLAAESKLKKWRCGCTTVRCATALTARCHSCGQDFTVAP